MTRLELNFGTAFNPAKSHARRQTQTLRCCGRLFRRWRFVGKQFPKSFPKKCPVCGTRFCWPANYRPLPMAAKLRSMRERARERSVNFLLQGLTTAGTPWKRLRHPNFINRAERNLSGPMAVARAAQAANTRKNVLANYHRRAQRFAELGLTSRGTVPKLRKTVNPVAADWQSLRSQIRVGIVSAEDYYTTMTRAAYGLERTEQI